MNHRAIIACEIQRQVNEDIAKAITLANGYEE